MAWEEALEAHVKENEQEFNGIARAFREMKTFVTEQILTVTTRIDRLKSNMNARFDAVDARFESVDRRFEGMDRRFEAIDRRFVEMDRRFDRLDGQVELLVKAVVNPQRQTDCHASSDWPPVVRQHHRRADSRRA